MIFQSPEQEGTIFQSPEQQGAIFQTSVQEFEQEPFNDDFLPYDDSKATSFSGQSADFTISCVGVNKICVNKHDCIDGYIHVANNVAYSLSNKVKIETI